MSKKRTQTEGENQKRKKARLETEENLGNPQLPAATILSKDEVDFPRGGGTNFSALEYKQIHAEAIKELKDEVFKVCSCVVYSILLVFNLNL